MRPRGPRRSVVGELPGSMLPMGGSTMTGWGGYGKGEERKGKGRRGKERKGKERCRTGIESWQCARIFYFRYDWLLNEKRRDGIID